MSKIYNTLIVSCLIFCSPIFAEQPIIYLQPNITQIFTEIYKAHQLNPPARTFFDEAIYLDQSTPQTILPIQPSNQQVFDHASQILERFHGRVGDLELYIDPTKPKPFFYTASGSKHLIVALVYAIAMTEPDKKFLFVQQIPYYSGHPNAVSGIFKYPNVRYLGFHDVNEIKAEEGEILVEIVTSPNNPDGLFRKPVTQAKIIMADFVFASSGFGGDETGYLDQNIAWVKDARAQGKLVFSFNSASKQFGITGARCGYIWFPMYDPYAALIFNKFFGFISASTVAGGTIGLAHFLDYIKAFIDLPDNGKAIRTTCRKSLIKRHELVQKEILQKYPGSEVISIPGSPTFFAKIKDARIPDKKASSILLEDFNVAVNNGEPMGESDEFIRLNLSGSSRDLTSFLNRLAGQEKYKIEDVLILPQSIL